MQALPVVTLYLGLAGLWFAVLSIRVPMRRAALGATWGDADDGALATRIRVFGNLAEYMAVAALLMAANEATGLGAVWLHGAGSLFLAARAAHAWGLNRDAGDAFARKAARGFGAFATWALIAAGSARLVMVSV